jgi:hypothetical protein
LECGLYAWPGLRALPTVSEPSEKSHVVVLLFERPFFQPSKLSS